MKELGFVDVVSYNTLLKAYLKIGQIGKARALLAEMSENDIQANQVTYNELLNALVTTKDRKEMWGLVREMSSIGMRPNAVTCSIILKSLTAHSATEDVRQAMALIDNMHEDMDEVLFASVVEACVRVGQLDPQLQAPAVRKLWRARGPYGTDVRVHDQGVRPGPGH
jgi:pentatricopeptide repeat protein